MTKISDLIGKRKDYFDKQNDNRDIIGIEIKRKRLDMSETLESISQDLCSPSYLCKIERNQIQANNFILQEVCHRVEISKKQQKMLFNFYEVLVEGIKAFLDKDLPRLKGYVDDGKGFQNYRYKILLLMYYILAENYHGGLVIVNELVSLIPTMVEKDMIIFSLFTGILKYKDKDYLEANKILMSLDTKDFNNDLFILYYEYLFYSSLMLGYVDTAYYYDKLMYYLIDNGKYNMLEDINYVMAIYLVKYNSKAIDSYLNKLTNEANRNSIIILMAIKNKDKDIINEYRSKPMNKFCLDLYSILDSKDGEIELIMHKSNVEDSFDYSANLLKYLCLKEDSEKYTFIKKQYDYYKRIKDYFMTRYFTFELSRSQFLPGVKQTLKQYLELLNEYEKN